jgi:hypothetical protein
MWVLNENKLELAKNKYGFKENKDFRGNLSGYFKENIKGGTIISFNLENKITSYGAIATPKIYQDLIYDLIKDDVIMIKRESEEEKINIRINKKEEKIKKIQKEIEELKKLKGE